jgi:DNA invertase Pin-like site-specific DNA recombinase
VPGAIERNGFRVRHGMRRIVTVRWTWAEAAAAFLVPVAVGATAALFGGPMWLTLAYVALGTVFAGARLELARRMARERPLARSEPASAEPDATAPARRRRAVGYVCVALEAARPELARHSEVIRRWAGESTVALAAIVHDVERPSGDAGARPALRGALERIAANEADTLVTACLAHLSPTAANLPPLLRWFMAPGRSLVAIDLRLDTATEAGRLVAFALADIGGWEHERLSVRTRRGLQAAREQGSKRGRASVADVPELRERIQRMRDDGMTLQAIADALNEAGVATLRGGAKWRPSSVQRAAGYRRPQSRQWSIDLPDSSSTGGDDGPAPGH